eukprot:gene2952-5753_t
MDIELQTLGGYYYLQRPVLLNNTVMWVMFAVGTFQLKGDDLRQTLEHALRVGYRRIDTATCYRNEEIVGEVVAKAIQDGTLTRDDLFITSKLAPKEQGRAQARAAVLASLDKLGLDYIDTYLIHWPGVGGLKREDTRNQIFRKESWESLEQLNKEEIVNEIGVSNYTIHHLQELLGHCTIRPARNQVEFHPLCQQKELRAFCNQHEIAVEAYSPLGCGHLINHEVVKASASTAQQTPGQVLLIWALSHVDLVAAKSTSKSRIQENLIAAEFDTEQQFSPLCQDALSALDKIDIDHHYCWNPAAVE